MIRVTGEAGGAVTQGFGNVIAGTTLVAGTAASTAGGAAYGVYELSKAVVVPTGYELGGGIVRARVGLAILQLIDPGSFRLRVYGAFT